MAETEKKGSQVVWSGYECPACFGIFRVPKGNEHREAICPRCESILRLADSPGAGVGTSPQAKPERFPVPPSKPVPGPGVIAPKPAPQAPEPLAPAPAETAPHGSEATPETGERPRGPERRKRRIKVRRSLESNWEEEEVSSGKSAWLLPVLLTGGGVVLLGVVVIGLRYFDPREAGSVAVEVPAGAVGLGLDDEPVVEPLVLPDTGAVDLEKDGDLIIEEVRRFLQAETLDEMLTRIRHRERLEMTIRNYHDRTPYQPTVAKAVSEDGTISLLGELVSVNVVMENFSVRPIALEKVGERRYVVDWESWVGYSEMTWDAFFRLKPRRAKQFRVVVSPVDYYNFDFKDDAYWKSFYLKAANGEVGVYGYLPRSSPLVEKLTPIDPAITSAAFVVKLRYPLESTSDKQVLIDEVICSGWVLDAERE